MIVGTKQAPPFAIKNPDGTWSGLSIELWREIADELQLRYEIREFDLPGLLNEVKANQVDIGVAALTVTAEREKNFDFTHPFYTTGLGIAILPGQKGRWTGVIGRFITWGFIKIVLSLACLLFIIGVIVWLFERGKNPKQFGGAWWRGLGAGFWWSAVTMTTVGYGDKAPVSLFGRLMAIIW
ncbi:transporter substrate-binding domain-containing protein, partial [Planctomycetota bacterium]